MIDMNGKVAYRKASSYTNVTQAKKKGVGI
jgi:hypothetical protein